MRRIILLTTILFSGVCFAQNTSSIVGVVLDGEEYNSPLTLANIAIEGTTIESATDENGLFHFENMAEGNYTLAFTFVGYETKKIDVQVAPNKPTNISVSLLASTLSLNDIASLNIKAKLDDNTSQNLNN